MGKGEIQNPVIEIGRATRRRNGLVWKKRDDSTTLKCSGLGSESIAESEEGGLGTKLGVEGERALGEAVIARAKVLEPGVAVGETPS